MKKLKWLALLLVAVMVLTACGGGAAGPSPADPGDDEASEIKIAVLLPSSPTDGGWGQIGAEGLQKAAEAYGIYGTIIEAGTADLMKVEAEALASEGFSIIFGHGGQYASPFSEIADDYPNTYFITAGGNILKDNLMPVEFLSERLNFIQGAVAASMTETNKIGLVIGGEFPSYKKTSRGFELGAKHINPDVEIMLSVTQNASDMNEGYELTLAQIQAGADAIWSNANQASQGSYTAARENGVWIFGTVIDATPEAPELVVATAAQDMTVLYLEAVDRLMNGNLGGEIIFIDVEQGGISFIWNENVKANLPDEIVALYDDLRSQINNGDIVVPRENEGW